MIRKLLILAAATALLTGSAAIAAGSMNSLCFDTNGSNCVPVNASNPLPVSGGGGGAATIADGADVTQGAIADAAYSGSGSGTVVAILKYIGAKVEAVRALLASPLAVTGTFWQATQPISGTVAATQSGAWSLSANQSVNAAQINGVTPLMGNGVTGTGSQRVTIASDNTAFNVNAVQSGTWNVTVNAALPAGTNLLGKVGIDQTTVGTTNAVSLAQIGATTIASGNGVVGAGVQRVAIASDNAAFSVNAAQSGTWTVTGAGGTFPVTGTFWQATQPVSIAAAPLQPLGITPTDRTITSASGSSQQIMAANASRHSMTITNTGNANCGVNPTGGTAAIGGAGTITVVPSGSYTPRVPTLSAVTVICTAAQPIYADEN